MTSNPLCFIGVHDWLALHERDTGGVESEIKLEMYGPPDGPVPVTMWPANETGIRVGFYACSRCDEMRDTLTPFKESFRESLRKVDERRKFFGCEPYIKHDEVVR